MNSGASTEVLFEYEALERGLIVSRPTKEVHYDCVVDNGEKLFRVQVKRTVHRHGKRWRVNIFKYRSGERVVYGNSVDIIAVFIKNINSWIFIESDSLKKITVRISESNKNLNNWNVFEKKNTNKKLFVQRNVFDSERCGEGVEEDMPEVRMRTPGGERRSRRNGSGKGQRSVLDADT